MVYIAVLPPAGELRTTWASTSPFESRRRRGKYVRAADRHARRLEPVLGERALQLLDRPALPTRTSVSRQCPACRPSPLHFPLMPEPPVTPTMPSTTRIRRWFR